MPRPSPQTDRVVALVELLAERPEAHTLAEITRRLGVNKSTCYSMLSALVATGWLLRNPYQKTYRLGPALLSVGQAAAAGFPALEFARPAMVELSRRSGSYCLALAVAPDHVTVVDQVRDVRATGAPVGQGHIPLVPPFGAAVAAWCAPEVAERWLGLAPPGTAGAYADALVELRRRGYVVELAPPSWDGPMESTSLPDVVGQLARVLTPDVLPATLEPGRTYPVSAVNAPVIDVHGSVVLIISLMGFPGPLTGADLEVIGQRLRTAAGEVSGALAGD
jgi:DNA-binding IclR family transcriptional regulator